MEHGDRDNTALSQIKNGIWQGRFELNKPQAEE